MTDAQLLTYLLTRLRKLPTELAGIAGENVKENLHTYILQLTTLTPSREDVDKRPVYWLLKTVEWLVDNYTAPE